MNIVPTISAITLFLNLLAPTNTLTISSISSFISSPITPLSPSSLYPSKATQSSAILPTKPLCTFLILPINAGTISLNPHSICSICDIKFLDTFLHAMITCHTLFSKNSIIIIIFFFFAFFINK